MGREDKKYGHGHTESSEADKFMFQVDIWARILIQNGMGRRFLPVFALWSLCKACAWVQACINTVWLTASVFSFMFRFSHLNEQ